MKQNRNLIVNNVERVVEWLVEEALPFEQVTIPWGTLWVGADGDAGGQGREVWVEASEPFELVLHTATMDFVEPIEPGKHRVLLTVLDRTDVSVYGNPEDL